MSDIYEDQMKKQLIKKNVCINKINTKLKGLKNLANDLKDELDEDKEVIKELDNNMEGSIEKVKFGTSNLEKLNNSKNFLKDNLMIIIIVILLIILFLLLLFIFLS